MDSKKYKQSLMLFLIIDLKKKQWKGLSKEFYILFLIQNYSHSLFNFFDDTHVELLS